MPRFARFGLLVALLLVALCPPRSTAAESSASAALPPAGMFQLPFSIDETWTFNGVHGPRKEAIDFSVGRPWPRWKSDTSNIWVVAAAPGVVRRTASCGLEIDHADGWTTVYYHLEHIVRDAGPVNANDRLANIANTPREAACDGGSSTAPHVHFALKHNGEFVPINGLVLSGWQVHSGRGRYDSNCARMYLARGDERLCPYTSPLVNHGIPANAVQSAAPADGEPAAEPAGDQQGDGPGGSAQIEVDTIAEGAAVRGKVAIEGWAVDHAGLNDSGIDHIHLYLDGPAGQGTFVAEAPFALERADVAAVLGDDRFVHSGFHYDWDAGTIAPGPHTLFIYAHSIVADWTYITRTIQVQQ